MPAEALSLGALFGWGCVGGAGGAVVTFTLPWLVRLTRFGRPPMVWQAVGGIGLIMFHSVLGGLAALLVGSDVTLARHAIAFGLAWPTVLKTAGETAKSIRGQDEDEGGVAPEVA